MNSTNDENDLSILLKELNRDREAKIKRGFWLEGTTIFVLMSLLVPTLLVPSIREFEIVKIRSWKWVVIGLVVIVGRLVSHSIVSSLLRLLQLSRVCRNSLMFYTTLVKGTLQKFIWFVIIFLVWYSLIYHPVELETEHMHNPHLTVNVLVVVVGCFLWLIISVLLKVHEIKCYVKFYFDRVRKSVLEKHVLMMLLSPLESQVEETSKINDLIKLNHKRVPARIIDTMINMIRHGGLPSMEKVGHIDKPVVEAVTEEILQNYFNLGSSSSHLENAKKFLSEQSSISINFIEGDQINEESLHLWVVTVYGDRQTLESDLKETNNTLQKQYQAVKIVVGILILNTWLLLVGFDKLQVSVLAGIEVLVGVCWSMYGSNT